MREGIRGDKALQRGADELGAVGFYPAPGGQPGAVAGIRFLG